MVLQLAEGARRQGKDRLYRWRIAAGSAAEVEVALEIAIAWGYVDARRMGPLIQTVSRLVRLTWDLMRPKSGSAAWRERDREP